MLFSPACLTLLVTLPIIGAIGGQIPVIDGVIGGVSSNPDFTKPKLLSIAATTPGKLRVVENSGICGDV